MVQIAMVTSWGEKCGIANYSAELVKNLEKLGTHVEILRTRIGSKNPLFFKKLAEKTREFDLVNVQYQLGLIKVLV